MNDRTTIIIAAFVAIVVLVICLTIIWGIYNPENDKVMIKLCWTFSSAISSVFIYWTAKCFIKDHSSRFDNYKWPNFTRRSSATAPEPSIAKRSQTNKIEVKPKISDVKISPGSLDTLDDLFTVDLN